MTVPKRTNPAQRLFSLPLRVFRSRQTPLARQIWRGLALLSLVLMGVGVYYAWRELPPHGLVVEPLYLGLAVGLYTVAYATHTLGWHNLATYYFGRLPLRTNAKAVAQSNLVKYLPTIAWYIANRVHFYEECQVPRKAVVTASLLELTIMIGSGSVLYGLFWLGRLSFFAVVLACGIAVGVFALVRQQCWWHGLWQRYVGKARAAHSKHGSSTLLTGAAVWYGGSWLLGVGFLWLILRAFVPLQAGDLITLFNVWLLAGLASYAISVTLGSIGVVRELTLTALLASTWPLPAAIATAIAVKLILTLGEIVCSGVVLAWLQVMRRKVAYE
jgi:hypothetical protein